MTVAAARAVLLLAGGGAPAPPSLTGTWEWGSFEKGGAPTYNMGFLEGRLTVKDGRAKYLQVDDGVRCEITFTFARESVVLKTISDDNGCPFGHQVDADGTYRRTSRKKPKFDLIPQ